MQDRFRRRWHVGVALVMCAASASCRSAGLGDQLKPPEFRPAGESKCRVVPSHNQPLVVEWPSTERGALEASVARGAVLVRYSGCEMQVLKNCHGKGRYEYVSITPKQDVVTIRDEDQLYVSLPVGAPLLESRLRTSGQLNVEMTLVGRYELDHAQVELAEGEGDCSSATHVVTGVTVGAFIFSAGADVEAGASAMGLGGGKTAASRQTITRDGDPSACQQGTSGTPPVGCGAMVRIEVTPLKGVVPKSSVEERPVDNGSSSTASYLLAGIGVVGMGLGSAFGLRTFSLVDQANQHCDGKACRDQTGLDLRSEANTYATASTVSFAVGLTALGAWVWVGPASSSEGPPKVARRTQVQVGMGSVGVSGTW